MLGMHFAKLDVFVWMHLEKGCIKPETLILKHRRLNIHRKTSTHLSSEHLFSSDKELPFLCALTLSATEIQVLVLWGLGCFPLSPVTQSTLSVLLSVPAQHPRGHFSVCVSWPIPSLASLLGCMVLDCNDNFVQGRKGV